MNARSLFTLLAASLVGGACNTASDTSDALPALGDGILSALDGSLWAGGDSGYPGRDGGGLSGDGGGPGGDSGLSGDGGGLASDGGGLPEEDPFKYTQLAIVNTQWTPSGVGSLNLLDMTALQAEPRCGTDNAQSACNVNAGWYGLQIGGSGAPLSAASDGGPTGGCAFPRINRALVPHNYHIGILDTSKPLSDIAATGSKATNPPRGTTWYTTDLDLPLGPNNSGVMGQLHGLPVDILCDQRTLTAYLLNDGRWESYADAIFALAWDGAAGRFSITRALGLSALNPARPNTLAFDNTRDRLTVVFSNSQTLVHMDRTSRAATTSTLDRPAGSLLYSKDGRYAYMCNCTKAGNGGNGYLGVYDAASFTRLAEVSTTYSSSTYVPDGTGPSACYFAADWADSQLWATYGGCGSNQYGRVVRFDITDPLHPIANDYRYGQTGPTYPMAVIYDPVPHPQQTSPPRTLPIVTESRTRVYIGFGAPTDTTNSQVAAYLAGTGALTYFNGTSVTDFATLGDKFPGSVYGGNSFFWVR